MEITGTTALVTGANRGIGKAFVEELLERGAAKVYATARDVAGITAGPRIVPLRLDITDQESVTAVARAATDVALLVNNAGIGTRATIFGPEDGLRRELDTNFFGPVRVTREFAPILAANGGGAVVTMLSVMSWLANPMAAGYSVAKAAAWAATNAQRLELAGQGTLVTAVHVGAVDTAMMADFDVPKTHPNALAAQALEAVEAGEPEVLGDAPTRQVKAALAGDLRKLYPELG
ncbi:SDR family oxidoreductase [Amycolatopsis jiangsuensis]|uniref:NAD(P)-dependent dehydrogenase (Short-subunit alcohol dehydrogenase family) n=1 Tax=Amycolatopsis jiangsuensis TaxID=1181879 RepID=A0A840IXB0_9PSEU|nr:SDR family oxidoreductase [Amycolatopsis jiangsuensis]MBB4685788.1 NAD(P)-dependent dehydrogenase (short-subunit alcohol dehydrogenase family) [Amycolatopsis jiangsuensis]